MNDTSIWDAADDGWDPRTAPRPVFVERRSVARCESCGHPADDPLRGVPSSPAVRRVLDMLHGRRAVLAAFFAGAARGRAEGAGGAR